MRTPIQTAFAIALALMGPTLAQTCTPTTTTPEVTAAGFYVEDDCDLGFPGPPRDHCVTLGRLWVYEESNGIPGLQRRDDFKDDTCGGQVERDTIHF